MKIIKLRRLDEPMFHHSFCPKCRYMFLEGRGSNYCSNCGLQLEGWPPKIKENFQKDYEIFQEYFNQMIESEINREVKERIADNGIDR